MIRRERLRLGRLFGALVLSIGAPAAAFSCSHTSQPTRVDPAEASNEASADVGSDIERALDSGAEPVVDAYVHDAHDAARDVGNDIADVAVDNVCLGWLTGPDAEPDGTDYCDFHFPCGLPDAQLTNIGCQIYQADITGAPVSGGELACWLVDQSGCDNDAYTPNDTGLAVFQCSPCPAPGGRMPSGLRPVARLDAIDATGAYFAQMAHDEAASIVAFARMHDELTRFGAPRDLIECAKRSRADEVKHARVMARLARAHRATPPRVRVASRKARGTGARDLEAAARENAVEGCVRETFAAMVATWQAAHVREPLLARTFARIARDETRHAALAHAFARWSDAKLDANARARVAGAKTRAIAKLRRDVNAPIDAILRRTVGLPTHDEARAMLDALAKSLWS